MEPNVNDLKLEAVRKLVADFLNSGRGAWTVQGLGMLRVYFSPKLRLHVWHSGLARPNVSTLHTHPWDFESLIVCGSLVNKKYSYDFSHPPVSRWMRQRILCGTGGCLEDDPEKVDLDKGDNIGLYLPGNVYTQKAEEIHETKYKDGTVTIVSRSFRDDTDHAYVFWPVGTEWVSAEPRPATPQEIRLGISAALDLL